MEKETILIVDDSEMNRSILADMLEEEYEILEAEDGIAALDALQERKDGIALILLDIVMPRMDGFGVLEALNQSGRIRSVPVIMISAESGSQQVERAYDLGVIDFIARPFDALIVRRRVVNTMLLYAKQKRLTAMVKEQIFETERRSSMLIEILSQVVEFRNGEGGTHVLKVRLITEMLLRALSQKTDRYALTDADISRISIGSSLHDIGKILVDEKLLSKPGRLTKEEFEIVKTHTTKGADILDALPIYRNDPLIRTAYEIARWHHERYDGRGYPDGLKGDDIPISAQVVALADVYDALISPRSYKAPIPHETAVHMIANGECGVFNPLLIECLQENADSIRRELSGSSERNVTNREIQNVVDTSMGISRGGVSDRTLRLLDSERMKNSFFSAMNKEITFEYTPQPPMLRIASPGAKEMGLKEIITEPGKDAALNAVLGDGIWEQLAQMVRQTTPADPDTEMDCLFTVKGQARWHRIHLRTIWSPDGALESVLGKALDIHDTREKLIELEDRASRDLMTGLFNRNAAMTRIKKRLSAQPDGHYALAIVDLDFFKSANDTYGHPFGDEVIKEVARRLLSSVRGYDIACRAGGDEFMLFLQYNVEIADIHVIMNRIFHGLCGPYKQFNISVTMGIALTDTLNGGSYDALFSAADAALYAAKRDGKGQYRFFDDSTREPFFVITEIEDHTRRAQS